MKLASISIKNYRTIEDLCLEFPDSFTAVCGPNDSGKTNVLRALRAIMREYEEAPIYPGENESLSVKDEFPKWLDTPVEEREIEITLCLEVFNDRDVGFYQFLVRQLQLQEQPQKLELSLVAKYKADALQPVFTVVCAGNSYSDLVAQDVFKRIQTSRSILFHDSPQDELTRLRYREGLGSLRDVSGEGSESLAKLKKNLEKGLNRIAKVQQQELEGLLGRLETRYKVGLSVPPMELGWLPLHLTLGDSKHVVPIDNWGSGTQNRTLILHRLFRARQISQSEISASKLTPLIVIEEPESFLHPYAQAEFGRVLHDLAEEFEIQVLVTTHSPYILSLSSPSSNILLTRRNSYGSLRGTQRVDSAGENWMAPFGQALGMSAEEFKPWRALFGKQSESVLLVEGSTDKEYFELLRDEAHGTNRLAFEGDIIPYEGVATLKNTILLRFVKSRYKRFFLTFDLDAKNEVERSLNSLGLKAKDDYLAIGLDEPGKRAIEGLVPQSIHQKVYSENANLVMAAANGTKDERESARGDLKKRCLREFKAVARPGNEYYSEFYKTVRAINAALKEK